MWKYTTPAFYRHFSNVSLALSPPGLLVDVLAAPQHNQTAKQHRQNNTNDPNCSTIHRLPPFRNKL
jgi:hypothetical protein